MKDLTLKTRVEQMLKQVGADRDLSEVPMAQKRRIPKSLEQYRQLSTSRDKAIAAVYASGGYSMKEIGEHFGLHYSRISRVLKAETIGMAKRKT